MIYIDRAKEEWRRKDLQLFTRICKLIYIYNYIDEMKEEIDWNEGRKEERRHLL